MLQHREQRITDGLHEEEERIGIERLKELTPHFPSWFTTTAETGNGAFFDAAAMDITGGTFAIENKVRSGYNHNSFNTTYIEEDKYANEKFLWERYDIPTMYINYWKDGHIYIFDTARLADSGLFRTFDREWVKSIRYRNPIDNKYYSKSGWRIKIPNKYAIHLGPDYRIVNREEYEENFKVERLPRKTGALDFDNLTTEKINSMTEWRTNHQC